MEIRVLGPLELSGGGRPVPVGAPKQRTVLALLLARAGTVVSVDDLVAELWDEDPPASAVANVRQYANNLRRLLAAQPGPAELTRAADGYRLTVDEDHLDLARFRRLVRAARDAVEAGDERAAVPLFDEGLALWRGAPAADVPAGRRLAAWRVAVQEERWCAVEDRAGALLGLGGHDRVSTELRELLSAEPLRERGHALLVRARYQAGDVAGALAALQAARRVLVEELGVEPGQELADLLQAVLRRDPALAAPRQRAPATAAPAAAPPSAAAPAPAPVVPRQLPGDVPGFAGRAAVLRRLDALLPDADREQPTGTVVVSAIAGTAGVGKTAVAVHWAHRVAHRFPDGQLYVNLRGFDPAGSPVAPAEALRGFLDAFAVPPARIPAGLDAQAALYRSLLAGRRVLVVLDNARDAGQVRPLLPGAPGCLAVVTSRNRLTSLVATDGAHPLSLDLLSAAEARQLLVRRLGAKRVAAEPAAVEAIVAACAGLPLALSIAAAQAQQAGFELAGIAAELASAGRRLDALDAGDAAGQVRAVFSWSYETLSPAAAALFRLLGLHPGPDVSVAAAASAAARPEAEVRRSLVELTRANLLTERAPGRFTFHDLLRAYAADLARTHDDEPARRAALTRLLDHYAHTAYAAELALYPKRDPIRVPLAPPAPGARPEEVADHDRAMAWLTDEHAVLLSAGRLCLEAGFPRHGWQLAWSLTTFLDRRGHWEDLETLWRLGLDAAERTADLPAQAYAHRCLAHAAVERGRRADGQEHHWRALELYRRAGDLLGQADTHRRLGYLFERQGEIKQALHHAERSLELYRRAGDARGQALALNALGYYQAAHGEYRLALEHCTEALALLAKLGDRVGEMATWHSLGFAHHKGGRYGEAVRCYERALTLHREHGDRDGEALVLVDIGDTHLAAGRVGDAVATWRNALEILVEIGDAEDEEEVRAKLGAVEHRPAAPTGG